MRTIAATILLLCGLALAQERPTLGVLEVRMGGNDPQLKALATSLVRGRVLELVQDTVEVVEGATLERMITANAQACSLAECLAQFARTVGVDYLLETRVWQAQGHWNAIVKLASSGHSSLLAERVGDYPDVAHLRQGLPELAEEAVRPLVWPALPADEPAASEEDADFPASGGHAPRLSLSVVSEPGGAVVRVDGRPFGVTPCRRRLRSGEHRIELEKGGYLPEQRLVVLAADGQNLRIDLSPIRGRLLVTAWDSLTGRDVSAEVLVEGVLAGRTPFDDLVPVGIRGIELRLPGYESRTVPVQVSSGRGDSLRIGLRASVRPVGLEGMARIPGGCFRMGSLVGDPNRGDDEHSHRVCLESFWLDRTEVTQEAWWLAMGTRPSRFRDCGPECPVEQIDWNQAEAFCRKQGKRLPTEAQWEYAAAGQVSGRANKGLDSSRYAPHPVGEDAPGSWGVRGLQGNVMEWVADWYGPYQASEMRDPKGPASGRQRVFRGAGWNVPAARRRVSARFFQEPASKLATLGFRCAAP